nr:acylphosphatase [Desulforamulus profundi]
MRVSVKGLVQGVGFRPFVYNMARSLGLTGWVNNTAEGVIVEVEGKRGWGPALSLPLYQLYQLRSPFYHH